MLTSDKRIRIFNVQKLRLLSITLSFKWIGFSEYFFLSFRWLAGKEIKQVHTFVDLNVAVFIILLRGNTFKS